MTAPRSARPVLLAASGVTLALVAIASFLPNARVWGINHLAWFPPALRWTLLALVAVCFVPTVARALIDGFLTIVGALVRPGRRSGLVLSILVAVASVALFWFLRTGTALLGDGHLLVRTYQAAQEGDMTLIPASEKNILESERIAIGTSLLYLWTGRLANRLADMSWIDGWRLFNCILGGLFVGLLLVMARSPGWSRAARLWFLILVSFSAIMLLFFGYPENYTPLFVCLLLFTSSSVRTLHHRGSVLWPVLTLVLAFLLHVQALVFLPALVYVLLWRGSRDPQAFVERRLPAVLAVGMLAGVAVTWLTPLRRYLLHWLPEGNEQAVLDLGHTVDILNEVLLVFPAVFFFVAVFFLVRHAVDWPRAADPVTREPAAPTSGKGRRGARSGRPPKPRPLPPTAWLQTRAEWHFFLLITWGCLLYLLFFEAEIGVARDWDLFAMIGIGLLPLAIILWNRYEAAAGEAGLRSHAVVMAPAIALTLVLGMSWVLLNHSMRHATRRFEAILTWETAKVPYGLEALAATYADTGNNGEAVRIMQKAVQLSPNKRLRGLLGTYHYSAGQYEQAREILTEELQRTPDDERLRTWLLRTLHTLGDQDRQIRILREGVQLSPDNVRYHLLLGELLLQHGELEEGLQHLRRGRQGELPPEARAHVDRLIQQAEERSSGDRR